MSLLCKHRPEDLTARGGSVYDVSHRRSQSSEKACQEDRPCCQDDLVGIDLLAILTKHKVDVTAMAGTTAA